jgi:hypothetical protein
LEFENFQTESIPQDLVSYEKFDLYAMLSFRDEREADVLMINSQIAMTAVDDVNSSVPLSKKFMVDVPFRGFLS